MTDHVHEWVWTGSMWEPYECKQCGAGVTLTKEQADARINATERLSSSLARRFAWYIDETTAARRFPALAVLKDILQEYAEVRVYGNIH